MTMVNDINGKAIDFEAAMALADPEICEEINNGLDGSETEQWFIERYAELRPATRAEEDRAVQKGRVFGYHRFDDRCPNYSDACYPFCPQFDGQEVE